jgi:tetratricopeptide (TPR) repeat protein
MKHVYLPVLLVILSCTAVNAQEHLSISRDDARSNGAEIEDFVGSETCAGCHRREYDRWRESAHARAGGLPSPETVIGPFDGAAVRFRDAVITPERGDNGEYVFRVEPEGEPPRTIKVDAVVGGGLMVGGGTQASFAEFPDGSWRFIPFDYSKHKDLWFCSTHGRGWLPIDESLSLQECQDWPLVWTKGFLGIGCQNCHGSQISLKYLPGERRYRTTVKSFSVNCESCHGPGRRHVEIARSGRIHEVEDIGMDSLELLDKDGSLQVCFQCHAKKVTLDNDYLPGDAFEDFYALSAPVLDASLHHDGRVRGFGYQKNHLYSDCYLNGSMTCVDCHAPHSQAYRDIYGTELVGRFDNQQCLGCHAAKADDPEGHSHHPADSPGNLCTSCHMPYLQHQEVGDKIQYGRSDHTIPIPRPAFDTALGIENACQKCHREQGLAWQQEKFEQWYGPIKPHKPIISKLLQAPSGEALEEMVLGIDGSHPLAELDLLGVWIDRALLPRATEMKPALVGRLRELAASPDIDMEATALMILHFTRGHDPAVRAFLDAQLRNAGPKESALRHRWAGMLWVLGMKHTARGDADGALASFEGAVEIKPDFADAHASLGDYYAGRPDSAGKAIRHYSNALSHGPSDASKHAMTLFKMGELYGRAFGDAARAAEAIGKAIEILPAQAEELDHLCRSYERFIGLAGFDEVVSSRPECRSN